MPEIPLAGFVLEALGAAALALMLSSFGRKHPRVGVGDWALGLWLLAAALLASVAVTRIPHPPLRTHVLAVAVVLAYWSPALVLLGTWARWNDREVPHARRLLLVALALLGLLTTYGASLAGTWGPLVRTGTRTLAMMAAHLAAGLLLLRVQASRPVFGARVLAVAFLGLAAEDGLFFGIVASGGGQAPALLGADVLVEVELVLLMLTGVGMVAWLLEEERESAMRLQEALHRREALSVMGSLVGGVAHEVRNPLFGISATLDALGAHLRGNDAAARLVALMREQVQRLSGLMADLLDYGRPIAAELTQQSVSAVAARAIELCAALAQQAGVSVELNGEPDSRPVPMDQPRVLQAFQNLVQNAVEHTPPGGRVRVEVRPELRCGRAGARFAVRDSGPGFDPADLPHVFEPFFSRRRGGTGLGLSIVHRIVVQHSGQIEAANHPEGGGVVNVWLPAGAAGPAASRAA
jgi:signal transduction histidine kinase